MVVMTVHSFRYWNTWKSQNGFDFG